MRFTSHRAKVLFDSMRQLTDEAIEYVESTKPTGRFGTVWIDGEGIHRKFNSACHCHPEYETVDYSIEEFGNWLDEKNNKESQK